MEPVTLEHLIYAPAPYRGYTFRAKSKNINIDVVKEVFKDWIIPFDQTTISMKFVERVIVLTPKKAYFSRVFQAPALDELKRAGVVSHIVEMNLNQFVNIQLSAVEDAMIKFVEEKGVPIGDLDPLTVYQPTGDDVEYTLVLNFVPRDVTAKIAQIALQSDRFRIFVLVKKVEREKIMYGLARKLLTRVFMSSPHEGGVFIASENVKHDVLLLHSRVLIVGSRLPAWARLKGWTIINLDKRTDEQTVQAGTTSLLDKILRDIYGQ